MNKNICKFTIANNEETLITSQFIYETNIETARKKFQCDTYRVYLALSNGGKFCFDTHEETIEIGSIYFLFQNETFYVKDTDSVEYMYICFEGRRVNKLFMNFGITPYNRKFVGCESLIPFWKESIIQANDTNIELITESVLLYTFSKLSKTINHKDDAMIQLISFIDNNYQNSTLSLSVCAQELGYHPKYISNKFKKYAGIGFNQYLNNVRIKHALQLFNYGIKSSKNVAILSGFNDPLYFSKVFKNIVGISPKEYLANEKKLNIK